MATITNCLDLYDIFVTEQLATKMNDIPIANWQYFPNSLEIIFSKAKSALGEKIFPLYNVYRLGPAERQDGVTSIANYTRPVILSEDKSIRYFNSVLRYQIDFFSTSMRDMNISNINWYKFQKDAVLKFDFKKVGLTDNELCVEDDEDDRYSCPVVFEDIAENHDLDNMFNIGVYYRYSYTIAMECLIFQVEENFKYDSIYLNLYDSPVFKELDEPIKQTIIGEV